MHRLAAFVGAGVVLASSGLGMAAAAQAAPLEPRPPLHPAVQQPLSPVSQQNAVRAAENYLSMMPFSYKGLIQQLTVGEGYSTADATFAVNSITVDWNAQAAKAAQNYLDMMAFSHDGLIQQLIVGDGYTPAQAAYGVATTGL